MMTKYAIVTGANAPGLGYRTAWRLACEYGYRVTLACRSAERGREAERQIRAAGGDSTFMALDLASLSSVRAFVDEWRALDGGDAQKTGLALLVNNAGVGFAKGKPRETTEDGFEETFGVNHLGHFLLTNLLLPDLQRYKFGPSRVVVVTSSLHDPAVGSRMGPGAGSELLDLHELAPASPGGFRSRQKAEEAHDSQLEYRRSKLANLLFAFELQRRLHAAAGAAPLPSAEAGCGVRVVCLNPGFIPQTNLVRHSGAAGVFFLRWVMDGLLRWLGLVRFTRSVDEGAACIVACATEEAAHGGGYYHLVDGALVAHQGSDESRDEVKAKALWQLSARLTGSAGSVVEDLHRLGQQRELRGDGHI